MQPKSCPEPLTHAEVVLLGHALESIRNGGSSEVLGKRRFDGTSFHIYLLLVPGTRQGMDNRANQLLVGEEWVKLAVLPPGSRDRGREPGGKSKVQGFLGLAWWGEPASLIGCYWRPGPELRAEEKSAQAQKPTVPRLEGPSGDLKRRRFAFP